MAKVSLKRYGLGHIVILPAHLPMDSMTDQEKLEQARYVGIYKRRPSEFELGGPGVSTWMGDEDGKGPVYDIVSDPSFTGTFAEWMVRVKPPSLNAGQYGSPSGTYLKKMTRMTQRQRIEDVCVRFGTEWRVTNTFALDCDLASALYRTTPIAMIVKRGGGRDLNVRGLEGGIELEQDLDDWTQEVRYYTGDPDGIYIYHSTSDGGVITPYRGPTGFFADITRPIEDWAEDADGAAMSPLQYARFDHMHEEVRLGSVEYDIGSSVEVGDNIWVYDPTRGLMDMNNEVTYRGQIIWPTITRCVGMTWPITRGMGVYFRGWTPDPGFPLNAWLPVWTDLTPYVDWESSGTEVDIGSIPRGLTT